MDAYISSWTANIGEFGLASSTDISVGFIRDPYGSFKVREQPISNNAKST